MRPCSPPAPIELGLHEDSHGDGGKEDSGDAVLALGG
jgi:hypothetical protein